MWMVGGGFPAISTMDKLTYSTETTAAVADAALSIGRRGLAATGNSTAGYFGGGGPSPSPKSTIDRVEANLGNPATVSPNRASWTDFLQLWRPSNTTRMRCSMFLSILLVVAVVRVLLLPQVVTCAFRDPHVPPATDLVDGLSLRGLARAPLYCLPKAAGRLWKQEGFFRRFLEVS